MSDVVFPKTLTAGLPENIGDVDANLKALRDVVNGLLDGGNIADGTIAAAELSAALATLLGVSTGGVTRRGKFAQAAEGTRTNVAYGALSNGPDVVTDLVLPSDGLILVGYRALWKESVDASARAAIFLDSTQLKCFATNHAQDVLEAAAIEGTASGSSPNTYVPLLSCAMGLLSFTSDTSLITALSGTGRALAAASIANSSLSQLSGEIQNTRVSSTTTAQTLNHFGGLCAIEADAGTYDISVQYKASSGTVTAKDRKLWAMALGF
jgi:hypothetical protein